MPANSVLKKRIVAKYFNQFIQKEDIAIVLINDSLALKLLSKCHATYKFFI